MASIRARLPLVLLLAPLVTACCLVSQQRTGGLEGQTRDTPQKAFLYFQSAARLERYDLEFDCFSREFIRKQGGFTQDEYLMARPLVYGEAKRILRALLSAEIVGAEPVDAPDIESARIVRLRLESRSEGYRGNVLVVRESFWKLGFRSRKDLEKGTLPDLRKHVIIRDDDVLVRIPLTPMDWEIMGFDETPEASEVTRVEVADRWSLLDIGAVLTVDKKKTESEVGTP